ncbi:hypothetical protein HJFPF1_03999 [Paramyrothecium foliicola]|nr:hypothetical protein HJFPF1_03999 [Paramyrothecium foliicola]
MAGARDSYHPLAISFLVIDAIAVGLRFWARWMKHAIGHDDIAMAISFVGFVIFVALELVAIENGIGATVMEPHFDMIKASKFFIIGHMVYVLSAGITKLSVALVLLRIAQNTDMRNIRITLRVSMVFVIVWYLGIAVVYCLQCRPLPLAWGVGTGTCISTRVLGRAGIALSAVDMSLSWFYGLFPIYLLRKVQLPLPIRLSIIFILGLGVVSSVATIIRLKNMVDLAEGQEARGIADAAVVEKGVEATLYSILEIGLSILAAALTALRPLVSRFAGLSQFSSGLDGQTTASKSLSSSGGILAPGRERIRGSGYRLDDLAVTNASSQEDIIGSRQPLEIQKESRIEICYEDRPITKAGEHQW